MKNLFIISVISVLFSVSYNSYAQTFWQQSNGPNEGRLLGVVFNSSGEVFTAASIGGVYRSNDNGLNWLQCPIDSQMATCIDILPGGNIIVGGEVNYVSSDNGYTWQIPVLNNTYGNVYSFSALAVIPNGTVIAGSLGGVFKSTDGGFTFDTLSRSIPSIAYSICVSPDNYIFLATNGNGIYRSTDNGSTWENKSAGTGGQNMRSITVNKTNGNLYASDDDFKIYFSNNKGESWNQIFSGEEGGVNFNGLYVDNSGTLFAACYEKILRTSDSGVHWDTLTYGLRSRIWMSVINKSSSGKLYACSEVGMFCSEDNGNSWYFTNNGIGLTYVSALAKNSQDHIYAATKENGLYRTTNKGASWDKMALTSPIVHCVTVAPNGYVFAGTFTDWWHEGGIFRSTDNGGTWMRFEAENTVITAIGYNSNGDLFAGTSSILFRSQDDGSSWHRISTEIGGYPYCIVQSPSGTMFAGCDLGIYKSIDNGVTWSATTLTGIDYLMISSIIFDTNGDIYASGKGIWRSTNAGNSWEALPSPDNFVFGLALTTGKNLYAATQYKGIFRTSLNSIQWTPFNYGANIKQFGPLLLDSEGFLYAGSEGRSVFRSRNTTTGVDDRINVLTQYKLGQNYPNPFNPNTAIDYQVANSGNVSIKVYDILGNEVKVLINEYKTAGRYKVNFNASNFASGVYIYKITAGSYIESRKMVLLK